MTTRKIEIYNDFGSAVGTANVSNVPDESPDREKESFAEAEAYKRMLRWLRVNKPEDNPDLYCWDWYFE